MRWFLIALLLSAGCGGGVDGKPIAPPTTPSPVPAPEPEPEPAPEPEPEPRVCTDEWERALAFHIRPILVEEWDGTPFRFYWDAGIPEDERADAEHFFGVVERFAERIEAQLGYPILEVAGWVEEDQRGFQVGGFTVRNCVGVRPGGIVATTVPEANPAIAKIYAGAVPQCGVVYWASDDIDTVGPPGPDSVMDHELFHLFGFGHSLVTHPHEAQLGGIPMTVALTRAYDDATAVDIDALGCVLPHPGYPRR